MKKRICFLSVLLLSLFVFCGRVLAAQELSCVYEAGSDKTAKMVVQDVEGNIKIFVSTISGGSYNNLGSYIPEFNSEAWLEVGDVELIYNGEHKINNNLTQCPEFSSLLINSNKKITLYDHSSYQEQGSRSKLYSSKSEVPYFATSKDFNGLVCIYGGGSNPARMLVQNTDGSKFLLFAKSGSNADINYSDWLRTRTDKKIAILDQYDEFLTSCPKYSSGDMYSNIIDLDLDSTFYFSNVKDDPDYVDLLHEYRTSKLPSTVYDVVNNISNANKMEFKQRTRFYNNFDYVNDDFFKNIEWKAKCVYGESGDKIELYFNDDTYILDVNRTSILKDFIFVNTSIEMEELQRYKHCPYHIFEGVWIVRDPNLIYKYDFSDFFGEYSLFTKQRWYKDYLGYEENELSLIVDESSWSGDINNDSDDLVIDNCGDLLGEDVLKIINDVMNWIKIIVPILLIVFGIVDFTKVIFSGKEDSMGKAGKTFLNRIIAAILVFVAPIFINLILSLANEVWSFINPNTCVRIEKSE